MAKKAVILLADGFEEIEALATCDILRRAGVEVLLVSVTGQTQVSGSHNIKVTCDCLLSGVDAGEFHAVILPGGMPGSTTLRDNPAVIDLVKAMHGAGRITAAICAAPIVLDRAGLLNADTEFTGYPGLDHLYGPCKPCGKQVVRDGNLITGNGPGASFAFGAMIAGALTSGEKAADVLRGMMVL